MGLRKFAPRKRVGVLIVAVVVLSAHVGTARAQLEIISPEIEQGEWELAAIGSLDFDDDGDKDLRHGHEFSAGYGVREWWMLEVAAEIEKEPDESLKFQAIGIENTLKLPNGIDPFPDGLDVAFFAAYEIPVHEDAAHAIKFGPIFGFKLGAFEVTLNPFFEDQFGDDAEDGIAFEYGAQIKYGEWDDFGLGLEAFGGIEDVGDAPPLDEQDHLFGPVLYLELSDESDEMGREVKVEADLGVLFGLTEESPDVVFKWNVSIEF